MIDSHDPPETQTSPLAEPASQLTAWVEMATLWGLGVIALAFAVRVPLTGAAVPEAFVMLVVVSYLSEFFFVHSSVALGSTFAERRAKSGKVGLRGWGCAIVLILMYALFVIPFARAIDLGWIMAIVVLAQMVRSGYHFGTVDKERLGERGIIGMILLFGPFLAAMAVVGALGKVTGTSGFDLNGWLDQPDDNPLAAAYFATFCLFFFGLSGFFASPPYNRWQERRHKKWADAGQAEQEQVTREQQRGAKLVEQLSDADSEVRRNALVELRNLRSVDPPDEALAALEDSNATVRLAAAKYFEKMYDERAAPILIRLLHDDDLVAEQAAESLCDMGMPEGIEAVTRYYREGPNPRTAYECGKELKKKPRFGVELSDGLQRFRDLLEDADPSRRELAVMALGRIGTADEAPLIERRLRDDAPNVRTQAENVLSAWRSD